MNIAIRTALNTGAKLARREGRITHNSMQTDQPEQNVNSGTFRVKCIKYDINGYLESVEIKEYSAIDGREL